MKSVQIEFLSLTKNDPRFPSDQRILLSQAYNLKAVADYETGRFRAFSRKGHSRRRSGA